MHCHALTIRLLLVLVTVTFAATAFAVSPKETVIYAFQDQNNDGIQPTGLVADAAGNLYGTTDAGGAANAGLVYELSPPPQPGGSWTFAVLYTFQGGLDGDSPLGALVLDSTGNLYGTTLAGGGSPNCHDGCGTVFELSPPAQPGGMWTESVLYAFQGSPTDGADPVSGVVFSIQKGNLYGTTREGGSGTCASDGCGTVFQLTPSANGSWTETVLYSFQGGTDGSDPFGGVIPDYVGNLYGTTVSGGDSDGGTIFELVRPFQPTGAWTEQVYAFPSNGKEGLNPSGGLTGYKRLLYGTTTNGGTQGFGTAFQVALVNGIPTVTVLHNFGCGDCTRPGATMVVDSAGNLYGTTGSGGCEGCDGTVFRLQPPLKSGGHWSFIDLYAFTNGTDGGDPFAGVIILNGALYGTAISGGDLQCDNNGVGCGVVYSITSQ
jgi:uncharacterized repeat protein (TIGR03803 family)